MIYDELVKVGYTYMKAVQQYEDSIKPKWVLHLEKVGITVLPTAYKPIRK